jgi:hypothetical protein
MSATFFSLPLVYSFLECGAQRLSRYSDSIQAERFGVRTPVGTRFSATVQAGPGTHPVSCIMGTGSLTGVKRTVRDVDHPPLTAPRLKKEYSNTFTPLLCLHDRLYEDFPFSMEQATETKVCKVKINICITYMIKWSM